jgi:putative ABC transport system permease protein
MNDIKLIAKNLFRKKLRACLMILSIMIAFAIFGVLASFERAFYAYQDFTAADRLVVVNKISYTQPLPISYYNRISAIDGVRQAAYMAWFGGYFQDPKNFLIAHAVEPESFIKLYGADLIFPNDVREAFIHERTGVVLGETLAKKWGWKAGDHFPISSTIFSQKNGSHTWDVKVVGIFKGRTPQNDTNFMVLQYAYLNETRTFHKDYVSWIGLRTDSAAADNQMIKTIDGMFANSPFETTTVTERAFFKAFVTQLGNIALIVVLVVGAAFVTILLIVGNTMMMAMRERAREIGVLKTLGFSDGRILRLVLGETLLLAALGGLPGLGAAGLIIWNIEGSLMKFVPAMTLQPAVALAGIGLMLTLGILTGLIPALGAMRLKIADALGRS